VVVDASRASERGLSVLGSRLHWNADQLQFDSTSAAPGWTISVNRDSVSAGVLLFETRAAQPLRNAATVVWTYFSSATVTGGTRLLISASAATDGNGLSLLDVIQSQAQDVCVTDSGVWGDATNNVSVDVLDAQQLARLSVGLPVAQIRAARVRGDVNADGTINIIDAQQIARYSVGLSAAARINSPVAVLPAVSSVELGSPSLLSMKIGAASQWSADLRDVAGASVAGCPVITWTSSNPAVASVGARGRVTAISPGAATITASSGGKSASVAIEIRAVVAGVEVSPSAFNLLQGGTRQLTATVRSADGTVLDGRDVTWESSDVSIATVSSAGIVMALATGTVTITATSEGRSGMATVVVVRPAVASVMVTPGTGAFDLVSANCCENWINPTLQLTAALSDSAGSPLQGRTITWASSDTAIAKVSSSGLVTAQGYTGATSRSVTITASSEGVAGTAAISVAPIPVASVALRRIDGSAFPSASSLFLGDTIAVQIDPRATTGTRLTERTVSAWATSPGTPFGYDVLRASGSTSGRVTTSDCTCVHDITQALFATIEGKTGAIELVVPKPVRSISVPSSSLDLGWDPIGNGVQHQIVATLKDYSGADITGRALSWVSSDSSVVWVSQTGLVRVRGPGTAVVSATRETRLASVSIQVPPKIAQLSIAPELPSGRTGDTLQLTAIARASDGTVLSNRINTWLSGDTTLARVVRVSDAIAFVHLMPFAGASTRSVPFIVQSEGLTASTLVTVTPIAVGAISVSPSAPLVYSDVPVQLTATAYDATGGRILTDRSFAWTSSDSSTARVSSSGLVTALKAGSATVTAWSDGISASVPVTTALSVRAVSIAPDSVSLYPGRGQQLSAQLKDVDGTVLTGRTTTWQSADTSVAKVTSSGFVTASSYSGGQTRSALVTATSEGRSGSREIRVLPTPVATVVLNPSSTLDLIVGGTTQVLVTLRDSSNISLTGRTIAWTSSDSAVATVLSDGTVSAISAGTSTVAAVSEGKIASVVVTVRAPIRASSVVAGIGLNSITASTYLGTSYIIREDGQLLSAGEGSTGEMAQGCGDRTNFGYSYSTVRKVVSRGARVMILTTDGTLVAAGRNTAGQLGIGSTISQCQTVTVSTDVMDVALTDSATFIVKTDGTLWRAGKMSVYTTAIQNFSWPVLQATAMTGVVAVSAGQENVFAVKSDGSLWAWGADGFGSLGNGSAGGVVASGWTSIITSGVTAVTSSPNGFSLALKTDGTLWGFGRNSESQLGVGGTTSPVPVQILDNVASMAVGTFASFAIRTDGTLWAMGSGSNYIFGDPNIGTSTLSAPTLLLSGVRSVAAGHQWAMVVRTDGNVWVSGTNESGQHGTGQKSTTGIFWTQLPLYLIQ
jgi:alpha-tubulin suppressor-like RCC1 family protein/uncharacterized protein YjdB